MHLANYSHIHRVVVVSYSTTSRWDACSAIAGDVLWGRRLVHSKSCWTGEMVQVTRVINSLSLSDTDCDWSPVIAPYLILSLLSMIPWESSHMSQPDDNDKAFTVLNLTLFSYSSFYCTSQAHTIFTLYILYLEVDTICHTYLSIPTHLFATHTI